MSILYVFSFFKSWKYSFGQMAPSLLAAGFFTLLAGCSTSMSKVETWQGSPPDAANAAILQTPGAIRVIQVNGRDVTNFLMEDMALNYALLPGENEVVFIYKAIWAKKSVVEDGESKVHVYKSAPQVVEFTAEPNAVYHFRFPQPETRSEAERIASDFSATLMSANGEEVTTSSEWDPSRANTRTPLPDAGKNKAGMEASGGSTLDRLKSIWRTASDEEKKEFLRWAFE